MRIVLIRVIQVLIFLIPCSAFVASYPPARLSTLVWLGRSSGCSAAETLQETKEAKTRAQSAVRIERLLRRKETDHAGFELWGTPIGDFWVPSRTARDLPALLAEQNAGLYGVGQDGVRTGDVVLDCGAHVGVFTREALMKGARLVVAIEISPENVECLRRTFAAEVASGRVIVCGKGVWDREAQMTLRTRPGTSLNDGVVMSRADFVEGRTVALTTIDRLMADFRLSRVDFIKLDVEGAEERALRGARKTLAASRPRLAVATESLASQPDQVPSEVAKAWAGYRMRRGHCQDFGNKIWPQIAYFE